MAIYPDKKDGKLTGRFRVEVQKGGERARGRFDTLKEAEAAEAQWLLKMPEKAVKREDNRGVPVTLKDLWDKTGHALWNGQKDRDVSKARLERMLTLVGGKTRIEDLSTVDLDRTVATLADEDLKGATINKYLSRLHMLLDWGVPRKYVKTIPEFPWQADDEGRIRWLSDAEEAALMRLLDERIAVLVKVAIETGMRRGELLELEKKNVEYSQVHIWKSKNKKARSVPISRETHDHIMWLLDVGLPTVHQIRYAWYKARKTLRLEGDPWFTFHVCRHTCATRLVQANVNLRVVQKWLGHKSIKTTERYAQVADETLSDALSRLEVFQRGHLAPRAPVGYASPTAAGGLPLYNAGSVKVSFGSFQINRGYGQTVKLVRGRGEIGRHAGFRFQWGNPCNQSLTEEPDDTEEGTQGPLPSRQDTEG